MNKSERGRSRDTSCVTMNTVDPVKNVSIFKEVLENLIDKFHLKSLLFVSSGPGPQGGCWLNVFLCGLLCLRNLKSSRKHLVTSVSGADRPAAVTWLGTGPMR